MTIQELVPGVYWPLVRAVPQMLAAIASLSIGTFALMKAPKKPLNRILAGLAVASFHYNLFQVLFNFFPSVVLTRIGYVGAVVLIPLLAEFPNALINNEYASRRTRTITLFATGFFLAALPTEYLFRSELDTSASLPLALGGPLMPVFAAVVGAVLLRLAGKLIHALWTCTDEIMRRRYEFVLLGEAIYAVCALHDILLRAQLFWVFDTPIVEWATLGFMMIVAYVTLRYRLMDVDFVIGMGVYYLLLTLATAALYKSVEAGVEAVMQQFIEGNTWWGKLLPAFIVTLCYGTLRELASRVTDWWFLPEGIRQLQVFRSPNFHYLVLDGRADELKRLRDEIDQLLERAREMTPSAVVIPASEVSNSPSSKDSGAQQISR